MNLKYHEVSLMYFGALLFLISLIQGLIIPYFTIPRMALSAHQAGIDSGIVLILIGLIWKHLLLKETLIRITFYSSIFGMYIVWFAITLSSILGASNALPLSGEGVTSSPTNELIVQILIMTGGSLCLVSALFIFLGLFKKARSAAAA